MTAKGEQLFADLVEPLSADPAVTPSSMMGLPWVRSDGWFLASLDRRSGARPLPDGSMGPVLCAALGPLPRTRVP